jgi:hypothetical protein
MRNVLVAVGLLAGLLGVGGSFLPSLKKVVVVTPDANPSGVLAGVSKADAALLREFYAAMADVVVRDGTAREPVCKTVFDLRNRHKYALSMAFTGTGIVGRHEGLGERLDQYLLAAVGGKDLPLTPDLREAAAKAFKAI